MLNLASPSYRFSREAQFNLQRMNEDTRTFFDYDVYLLPLIDIKNKTAKLNQSY